MSRKERPATFKVANSSMKRLRNGEMGKNRVEGGEVKIGKGWAVTRWRHGGE